MAFSTPGHHNHKRKRSVSRQRTRASALPPETINPHSHPPNLLKQFRVAGLPDTELLPSVPDFPHRALPRGDYSHGGDDDEEVDDDGEESAGRATTQGESDGGDTDLDGDTRKRKAAERRLRGVRREKRERERNIGVLAAILRRCVEEGDMVRAKRAFGLLVRAKIDGRAVDLRTEGFWGLGAEILMRDGVKPDHRGGQATGEGGEGGVEGGEGEGKGRGMKRRWGSVQNMVLVRRFLEDLIQLHPYNRLHPESVSALDFYPVLFGCEMYNVHAELEMALERVEEEQNDEDSEMQQDDDVGTQRERRVKAAKDELREGALEVMRRVAARMDELMMTLPYSKSLEMLRLRGMIALFMGDLEMPAPPREEDEEEEGARKRDTERERAVGLFKKVLAGGGELEPWIRRLVVEHDREGEDDEEDSEDDGGAPMPLPVFSSLPMR